MKSNLIKARMKGNLLARYEEAMPNELEESRKIFGDIEFQKTINLLKSIEGKVVELVFIGDDAFEKNDNNLWLPDCLWTPVSDGE